MIVYTFDALDYHDQLHVPFRSPSSFCWISNFMLEGLKVYFTLQFLHFSDVHYASGLFRYQYEFHALLWKICSVLNNIIYLVIKNRGNSMEGVTFDCFEVNYCLCFELIGSLFRIWAFHRFISYKTMLKDILRSVIGGIVAGFANLFFDWHSQTIMKNWVIFKIVEKTVHDLYDLFSNSKINYCSYSCQFRNCPQNYY